MYFDKEKHELIATNQNELDYALALLNLFISERKCKYNEEIDYVVNAVYPFDYLTSLDENNSEPLMVEFVTSGGLHCTLGSIERGDFEWDGNVHLSFWVDYMKKLEDLDESEIGELCNATISNEGLDRKDVRNALECLCNHRLNDAGTKAILYRNFVLSSVLKEYSVDRDNSDSLFLVDLSKWDF